MPMRTTTRGLLLREDGAYVFIFFKGMVYNCGPGGEIENKTNR